MSLLLVENSSQSAPGYAVREGNVRDVVTCYLIGVTTLSLKRSIANLKLSQTQLNETNTYGFCRSL